MQAERDPETGQARITTSEEEVRSGAFGKKLRQAVRLVQGGQPPELGQEPPQAEGYVLSGEVATIVRRLVEGEDRFAHLEDMAVGCAMQVGKKPEGRGGLHLLARAIKAPALWRDLGEFEVVLWVNAMAWEHLSERQREALVAHELNHVGQRNEQGNVVMLEHDIEEFAWVARTYGQWHSGLEHFAEQLGLGLRREE